LLESRESDALTLAGIAERLGLHTDYLSRRLRMETGLSISQLRNRARLVRAKRALQNFDSVAKAADACGFADANYFARWFRRQTGMSPLAWKLR
jgi:AraC family L-rhamnose operon transcriptional activator RhaR